MERKIGEIFEYNGEWYQCVEQPEKYDETVCNLCDFHSIGNCNLDRCSGTYRSDKKSVIFKKLEKVGEPYDFQKRTFQTYKLYMIPFLSEDVEFVDILSKDNNTIEIELKQKEDMEEYKMHDAKEDIPEFDKVVDECLFGKQELKFKPFDLQKAKAGKPVCTRDGRKARIICFDGKGDKPIIALVEAKGNKDVLIEKVERYFINGHSVFEVGETNNDLMMLPEKKEGWVNIYKSDNDKFSAILGSAYVYNTKEEAIDNADPDTTIATVKISWWE